jgi:hypothetical protein
MEMNLPDVLAESMMLSESMVFDESASMGPNQAKSKKNKKVQRLKCKFSKEVSALPSKFTC